MHSYEDWLREHKELLEAIRKKGLRPAPITINPEELEAWCKRNALEIDGGACIRFAMEKARKEGGGSPRAK